MDSAGVSSLTRKSWRVLLPSGESYVTTVGLSFGVFAVRSQPAGTTTVKPAGSSERT